MQKETILMVDDEEEIRGLVKMFVEKEGFTFIGASSGREALSAVKNRHPHIILLDIFLPDIDGVELCQQIRKLTDTPILFVSCKDSELDKVVGLSVGGDDYISKPFSPMELVARVKAHLRRNRIITYQAAQAGEQQAQPHSPQRVTLSSESLQVNLKNHDVFLKGRKIHLSAKEFQLLTFFMKHSQHVLSTEHLLQKIWGYESTIDHKTVMVHIANLRKKIHSRHAGKQIISTIRGAGYMFNEKVESF